MTSTSGRYVYAALAAAALVGAAACGGGTVPVARSSTTATTATALPTSPAPTPAPPATAPPATAPPTGSASPVGAPPGDPHGVTSGCGVGPGLGLPADWPRDLPLPDHLVVTRVERRSGDRVIAYARVPGDFRTVVRFFTDHLPPAGITQRDTEVDPRDAESTFTGSRVRGRWTVARSAECDGTSNLTVLVQPAGARPAGTRPATSVDATWIARVRWVPHAPGRFTGVRVAISTRAA